MSANSQYLSASTVLASLPLLVPNVPPSSEQIRELSSSLIANLSALQGSKELATSNAVSTQGRANAVAAALENAVSLFLKDGIHFLR